MDVTQAATASLPEEIVFDILTRLPVKSVCRFKRVSKTWLPIISDPKFVKSHSARSKSRPKLSITICSEGFCKSRSECDAQGHRVTPGVIVYYNKCGNEECRCIFIANLAAEQEKISCLVLKRRKTMPVEKCSSEDERSPGDQQSVAGLMFGICYIELIRIVNPSTNSGIACPRAFPRDSLPSSQNGER